MSDNVDPEVVKAAVMADLSRIRQEELPLSNEPKRGPTFAPTRNNGTGHYSNAQKAELESKWSIKIVDEESEGMEGLIQGNARPWAKTQARQMLSTNKVDNTPPAFSISRGIPSSHRPQRAHVEFKAPTPAKWGPPPTQTASLAKRQQPPSVTTPNGTSSNNTATNAAPPNDTSPASRQQPSSVVAPNGASSNNTPTNVAPLNGTSRAHLVFELCEINQDANASECLLGSGQCDIVPGRNEALSFNTKIAIKILIAKNEGILELRNNSKGLRSHNALDIEKPVVDGVFCTVKVKSTPWPYYLRFGTVKDVQNFEHCLSKLQDALQAHQPETDIDEPVMDASPISSTAPRTPSPGLTNNASKDVSQDTTGNEELLIDIEDDYGTAANNNLPDVGQASEHLSRVMDQILGQLGTEQMLPNGAMDGIMDAIFEEWTSNGFLKECSEELRDGTLEMLRYAANLGGMIYNKATQSATDCNLNTPVLPQDAAVKQTEESSNRAGLGMPKGLGASRFAKKPVAYEGKFTGPQF
ncbi:hypothetical protein IL306_013988 [Fusarium sp. DS 682]|nr:hypothetical protein IL306_013988 [Fusarium sp. DS 682]